MTATGHAVIGTVLAAQITNPWIGIPVAIISHFAADAYPHWDTGTNQKKKSHNELWIHSLIDLVLSFIVPFFLMLYLRPEFNIFYLYSMVIAAQLPDWLAVPYVFFKSRSWLAVFLADMQKHFDYRMDKPWGIIWQVVVLVVLITWAKLY